ncbi:hypothetical protein KKB06_00285 [Patescibacteria group bacterium]|nr:hypothetical protein [Patescibacteria group bacterium]
MSFENIPWQVLILVSSVITTLSVTINKFQSHRGSALQVLGSKYIGSLSWMLFWWMLLSKQIPNNWWMFYLYGFLVAGNLIIYTKAQRINMSFTSLADPAGQIAGVLLAAVVLSEWSLFFGQSGVQMTLAFLLMPVMLWLFYDYRSINSKKWIKLILIYLIISAVFKVLVKIFVDSSQAVEVLIFQYAGSLTACLLGLMLKKQFKFFQKKFVLRGVMHGIIGSSGILILYSAIKMSTVSQTTLLRTPLMLGLQVLIGLVLFKERKEMTVKKWIGVMVVFIIAGLVITANY